jgi:hypothetical protein
MFRALAGLAAVGQASASDTLGTVIPALLLQQQQQYLSSEAAAAIAFCEHDAELRSRVIALDVNATADFFAAEWGLGCMRYGVAELMISGRQFANGQAGLPQTLTDDVKADLFPSCTADQWNKLWTMQARVQKDAPCEVEAAKVPVATSAVVETEEEPIGVVRAKDSAAEPNVVLGDGVSLVGDGELRITGSWTIDDTYIFDGKSLRLASTPRR